MQFYGIVAAMLYLGNVKLEAQGDNIVVSEATAADLKQAESLIGIGDISQLPVEKVVKAAVERLPHRPRPRLAQPARRAREAHVLHDVQLPRRPHQPKIQVDRDFHKFIGRSTSSARSSRSTRSSSSASTTPTSGCTTSS